MPDHDAEPADPGTGNGDPQRWRRRLDGTYRADGLSGPTRRYVLVVALLVGLASLPTLAAITIGSATIDEATEGPLTVPFLPPPSGGPVVIPPPAVPSGDPPPPVRAAEPAAEAPRPGAAKPRAVEPPRKRSTDDRPRSSDRGRRTAVPAPTGAARTPDGRAESGTQPGPRSPGRRPVRRTPWYPPADPSTEPPKPRPRPGGGRPAACRYLPEPCVARPWKPFDRTSGSHRPSDRDDHRGQSGQTSERNRTRAHRRHSHSHAAHSHRAHRWSGRAGLAHRWGGHRPVCGKKRHGAGTVTRIVVRRSHSGAPGSTARHR